MAACPRAAISNISKQNNLKETKKTKQNYLFWIFFFSWCSTPKIQLFSHWDINHRSNTKIRLGDDEAPPERVVEKVTILSQRRALGRSAFRELSIAWPNQSLSSGYINII